LNISSWSFRSQGAQYWVSSSSSSSATAFPLLDGSVAVEGGGHCGTGGGCCQRWVIAI